MTSFIYSLYLLNFFSNVGDTIKIPATEYGVFERSINTVSPLQVSNLRNDSLLYSFNKRILFKDFFLDKKIFQDSCNKGKFSIFIGYKNDSISLGFDLNENGIFEASEVQKMSSTDKKIITYKIYPKEYCNISSFSDSTIIYLIPFVNQVKYTDISSSDTMLQITYSKGFSKKYTINDSLQLFCHTQTVKKTDSNFVFKYILKAKSLISAIYPDKDLLKIGNNFYSLLKNINKDTLYLVQETNRLYDNKIVVIPDIFFKEIKPINIVSKKKFSNKFEKKIILLDFWATWCVPCIKSMPYLKEIKKNWGHKLQIISFCVDDTNNIKKAKEILRKNKLSWQHYFVNGKKEKMYDFLSEYGIISYPTYILIDEKGNILKFSDDIHKINFSFL